MILASKSMSMDEVQELIEDALLEVYDIEAGAVGDVRAYNKRTRQPIAFPMKSRKHFMARLESDIGPVVYFFDDLVGTDEPDVIKYRDSERKIPNSHLAKTRLLQGMFWQAIYRVAVGGGSSRFSASS